MSALTVVKPDAEDPAQHYDGFTLKLSAQSPRLLELASFAETIEQSLQTVVRWPVQVSECKSFLCFKVDKILNGLHGSQLQPLLPKALLDRVEGALLVNAVDVDDMTQTEEMVKLTTAVAHLIGRPSFDAVSGQYYARSVAKNADNSDSYPCQPHRVMELHNNGTHLEEVTDYVPMVKIDGQNMTGGNLLLLHPDDWEYLEQCFTHPLAHCVIRFVASPGKNASQGVFHPVFDADQRGRSVMYYIDQFVQPKDYEEGIWLSDLSGVLETNKSIISVPVSVGRFLLISSLLWLYGRDRFTSHSGSCRELMRRHGHFTYATNHYQTHQ